MSQVKSVVLAVIVGIFGCNSTKPKIPTNEASIFNVQGIPFAKATLQTVISSIVKKNMNIAVNKSGNKNVMASIENNTFGNNEFDVMKDPLNAPFLKFDMNVSDFSYYVGQIISLGSDSVIRRHSTQTPIISGASLESKKFNLEDASNSYSYVYENNKDASVDMPFFGFKVEHNQKAIYSVDRIAEFNAADQIDMNKIEAYKNKILAAEQDLNKYYVVMGLTAYLYKAEVYEKGNAHGNITVPMYAIRGDYFQGIGIKKRLLKAQVSLIPITQVF
jgi:hypothetical protein